MVSESGDEDAWIVNSVVTIVLRSKGVSGYMHREAYEFVTVFMQVFVWKR